MGNPEIMFSRSPVGKERALRQGEILSNVVELQIDPKTINGANGESVYDVDPVEHPFAIVV